VIAGLVERVTFHNAENGFCVLRAKARGHRDLVTVVGHAAVISAGEWITASGEWINDRAHGQQFKARFLKTSAPSSIEGIEKYLGSGMIRGIKFMKYPSTGKPVVDELFGNLSATAPGVAGKALDRATNVMRRGDRANVLMVLGGAAFVGWLLARHFRQK